MRKRIYISAAALMLTLVLCVSMMLPIAAEGSDPVAENFEFETYRGTSFGGQLSAVDPDGDTLRYEITTEPVKGTITVDENGAFVYAPFEDSKGRDYFGYKAIDSEGNTSQEATVIIKLIKAKKAISYADMVGDPGYYSAVKLAECGAFVGQRIGGIYYFEPDRTLTRGEFLSMCLEATGADILSGVVSTGFSDDADIPDWEKSYVSTAVKCGIVKGHVSGGSAAFDSDKEISRAEAMVMLSRALQLTDVSYVNLDKSIPSWAAQSAANLTACNVAITTFSMNNPLTRVEAARMLASAMDLIETR